ncbi:hypothetical protein [Flavobacterium phage V186]|nr:hypothetical protein [Flavobacterium phage FCOV-S1]QCW21856.1 hypothetical protein [Flavobacterium phage FCOV-S2]QCW21930.1 hypothetical protein [Flavobacterium phage V186]QNJ53930.1 hypothetical protein [Flavobacterium phage FCOV-F56]QNJ54156.1 hypothetical protein [Flavobacterium phage V186]
MKGKYLITTDAWFYAPDGKQYRAVCGDVEILSDNVLGIKTNVRSSNWFVKVGTELSHIIIAGCQIHYAIRTDEVPNMNSVFDESVENGEVKKFVRSNQIYVFE